MLIKILVFLGLILISAYFILNLGFLDLIYEIRSYFGLMKVKRQLIENQFENEYIVMVPNCVDMIAFQELYEQFGFVKCEFSSQIGDELYFKLSK